MLLDRPLPPLMPPPLAPGARVALVAPAGPLRGVEDLQRAEQNARAFGWEPVVGASALARGDYFAGADAARLADLNAALRDPRVDGIWCLRGGYGAMRLLDGVDYDAMAAGRARSSATPTSPRCTSRSPRACRDS
jgi:muramoyltetrapeptide carboxypeptidase